MSDEKLSESVEHHELEITPEMQELHRKRLAERHKVVDQLVKARVKKKMTTKECVDEIVKFINVIEYNLLSQLVMEVDNDETNAAGE